MISDGSDWVNQGGCLDQLVNHGQMVGKRFLAKLVDVRMVLLVEIQKPGC